MHDQPLHIPTNCAGESWPVISSRLLHKPYRIFAYICHFSQSHRFKTCEIRQYKDCPLVAAFDAPLYHLSNITPPCASPDVSHTYNHLTPIRGNVFCCCDQTSRYHGKCCKSKGSLDHNLLIRLTFGSRDDQPCSETSTRPPRGTTATKGLHKPPLLGARHLAMEVAGRPRVVSGAAIR